MTENIKCLVLGVGGVGKTSMLCTYSTNGVFPSDYCPTIFDNYNATVLYVNFLGSFFISHKNLDSRINMFHLGCGTLGEDYHRFRPLSYPETSVFLILFSVNDLKSARGVIKTYIPEINVHCPGVPIIIVASKTDLRDTDPAKTNMTPLFLGKKIAIMSDANNYFETSSLRNEGLKELFEEAIRLVLCPGRFTPQPKKKKKLFGIFGGGVKKVKKTSEKEKRYFLEKYKEEIKEDNMREVERLKKMMCDEIMEGRKERHLLEGLSRDIRLHILQNFVLISFAEPHYNYSNRSSLFERRDEFYFFLEELGLGKENIILKCFGYFADDKNKRNSREIHQLFYNFQIDNQDTEVVYQVPNRDYIGIQHLPRMKIKLESSHTKVFYQNYFRKGAEEEVKHIDISIHNTKVYQKWLKRLCTKNSCCQTAKFVFYGISYPEFAKIHEDFNQHIPALKSLYLGFRMQGNYHVHAQPEDLLFYNSGYTVQSELQELEKLTLVGEACHSTFEINNERFPALKYLDLQTIRRKMHSRKEKKVYPEGYFHINRFNSEGICGIRGLQKLSIDSYDFSSYACEQVVPFVGEHEQLRVVRFKDTIFEEPKCWDGCQVRNGLEKFVMILGSESSTCGFSRNNAMFVELLKEKSNGESGFSFLISEWSEEEGKAEIVSNIENQKRKNKFMLTL